MPNWTFLNDARSEATRPLNADPAALKRYQQQTLSDIYHVVQSRLDSYRQSAAAIFLGVLAAVLTFDSSFIHTFVDPKDPLLASQIRFVAGGTALLGVVSLAGALLVRQIGIYFAEMTSIVYTIDTINRVWDDGVWLHDQRLFPYQFRHSENVGRCKEDRDRNLQGWSDPAINLFLYVTGGIAVLHFAAAVALFALLGCSAGGNHSAPASKPGLVAPPAPVKSPSPLAQGLGRPRST